MLRKDYRRDEILLTLRRARLHVGVGQIKKGLSYLDEAERIIRKWTFQPKGAYLSKQ
jgi:hypothetical protein